MEKKHLWFLVVVLVIVNFYSLTRFSSVEEQVDEIVSETQANNYISETFRNINRVLIFGDELIKKLPGEKYLEDNTIQFYFLFRGQDCTNCITETWEILEGLIENNLVNEDQVGLFYYYENGVKLENMIKGNAMRMKLDSVIEYKYENDLTDIDITISPLLIVAKGATVLDAYQPEPGNLLTRDAFWRKWERILILTI